MQTYLALLRGINVGGKNTVSMAKLKECLQKLGFEDVATYINSGNVIVSSNKKASAVQAEIEQALLDNFKLDTELIKVLILTHKQLKSIIDDKPKGFGEQPEKYYSDAIFLMDISVDEALEVFDPKEGIDAIWPGKGVIYSQRLGAQRTKSRLGKIIGTKPYKSMTIRSWNTTTKLLKLLDGLDPK